MKYADYVPAHPRTATAENCTLVAANFDAEVPAIWQEIAELNFAALRESIYFSALPDCCLATMAVQLVYELVASMGGQSTYLPNGYGLAVFEKNTQIVQDFDGTNIKALARKNRISEMRVRQILQEDADRKKAASKAKE